MNIVTFLRKDFKENPFWYCFIMFIPIVVYIYEMANFPLTQDEMRHFKPLMVTDPEWIKQGRWGMFILTTLFSSNPVFPALGIYLSTVLSLISIRILTSIRGVNIEYVLLFSILFVSYPSLIFLYSFSTLSFSVGLIYIISTFSALMVFSKKRFYKIISVLLLLFALSIYQSSASLFITMFFIILIIKNNKENNCSAYILNFFSISVISLIGYFLSVKLSLFISNYSNSSYIAFIKVENNLDFYYFIFLRFIESMYKYYLHPYKIYLSNNYTLTILTVFSIVYLLTIFIKNKNWIGCFCIIMIIISPFSLNILSSTNLPTRSLIALPLSVSFLIFYCTLIVKNKTIKSLLVIFILISAVYNLAAINRLSFSDSNSWKNDTLTAELMINRIYSLPNFSSIISANNKVPIHLVGYTNRYKTTFFRESENIGKGFFDWGSNELQNITNLFGSLGNNDFDFAKLDSIRPLINYIRYMPVWPNKGSIDIINGIVIVKMSDYTETQHLLVCDKDNKIKSIVRSSCSVSYNPQSIPFYFLNNYKKKPDTIFNIFYNDFKVLHEVKISHTKQKIKYTPTTNDSQIIFPSFMTQKNILLSMNLFYQQNNKIEFYFKNNTGNYVANNIIRLNVKKGQNIINLILPGYLFKNGLRIDLTSKTNKIYIKKLKLIRLDKPLHYKKK